MRFDNQVVMITGAAGSLGKAVAAGFAAGGARLALADVSEAVLQQAYPGTADTRLLLPANLLDSASAQNAVNAAMQKFGRLDALCNIAGGFAMGTPVHATAAADWQKMQDINVGTLLNAVRAAVPAMLAGGAGEMLGNFFDARGRVLETTLTARLLAVDLDGQSKTRIVAIAGAVAKTPAIRAVLESGRLTGLITDEPTARALLA